MPVKAEPKLTLEQRFAKAGIDLDDLAELLWKRLKPRIVPMLKHMAEQRGADRRRLLEAAVGGLCVRWGEDSGQKLAELAERIVTAVMREEEKRQAKPESNGKLRSGA
jgi:hypothetical protein